MNMTGMTGPAPIAIMLGVLMLFGAVLAAVRIVGALRSGDAAAGHSDVSVDACHGIMGLSMAGMLMPSLQLVTPGPSLWTWFVVQSLVTVWFVVSTVRELVDAEGPVVGRLASLHHLPHIVLSGAMVYMLYATQVMSGPSPTMGAKAMMVDDAALPLPTLDLLLALFLVGYTVLLVDRLPFKVARAAVFAPRSAAGLGILMAAAMSYMLVMMFVMPASAGGAMSDMMPG